MPSTKVVLSTEDQRILSECEGTIHKHQQHFIDVAVALATIRDKKLYQNTHATFADYCRERWDFTAHYARYIINGAETAKELADGNPGYHRDAKTPVVTSEKQMRPLRKLGTPAKRLKAFDRAVKSAAGRPPTVRQVSEAVSKVSPGVRRTVTLQRPMFDAYTSAPSPADSHVKETLRSTETVAVAPAPIGRVCYEAYANHRQWRGFNGDKMPQWATLKPDMKLAWQVAAQAAVDAVK